MKRVLMSFPVLRLFDAALPRASKLPVLDLVELGVPTVRRRRKQAMGRRQHRLQPAILCQCFMDESERHVQ